MKEGYKEYLEEKVAPYIYNIAKERDYTDIKQVQELFRSIKSIMDCQSVAYFTPHSFDQEYFFVPKGYFYSDGSFPEDLMLDYHSVYIQKPLTSGKYFLIDIRSKDKIESIFEEHGIKSVIAAPTENEFSYGVLFAFNGNGIEKSEFNPSFNILQCNIFLLISKFVDLPVSYEIILLKEIRELNDEPLSGSFLSNLMILKGEERLVDGIKTYYRQKKEISFILLTPKRILSIVQKDEETKTNAFFLEDIVSINERNYIQKGVEKVDIEIEFTKGSIAWGDVELIFGIKNFLKNIKILVEMNKGKS